MSCMVTTSPQVQTKDFMFYHFLCDIVLPFLCDMLQIIKGKAWQYSENVRFISFISRSIEKHAGTHEGLWISSRNIFVSGTKIKIWMESNDLVCRKSVFNYAWIEVHKWLKQNLLLENLEKSSTFNCLFTEWHWLYIRFQGICPDVLFFSSIFIMISELCCQSICFCKTILPELTILTFDIGSILQFLWAFLSASCYDGQTRIFPIVSGSQCLASPIQEVPRCNLFVQFPSSRFEKDFSREILAMSLDRCLERRRSSQVNKTRAKLPWSRKVEVSLLVLDKKLLEQLKKRGLKIEENTVAGHFREDWQLSWRRGGRCQAERSYSLP